MVLPAIAFIFMMVKYKDVGAVEGTTMWVVFFLGLWLASRKSGTKSSTSNLNPKPSIQNPLKNIFSTLTTNQKMSIINMLIATSVGNDTKGSSKTKRVYLNQYIEILDVYSNKCTAYFEAEGLAKMMEDLNLLSKNQKEFLVIVAWGMITCDGPPSDIELEITGNIFNQLGILEEEFVAIVHKSTEVAKRFNT